MATFQDAFISYARKDSKSFAISIKGRLEQDGFILWLDLQDIQPTAIWRHGIREGIENAHNFIYIISPGSVQSEPCREEIDIALSLNKRIVPLLHVSTPRETIPTAVSDIQWIPFQDGLDDFESAIQVLRATLQENSSYLHQHTSLLTQALKWERNQRRPAMLLRGHNLRYAENWLKIAQARTQQRPTDLQAEFIAISREQPPEPALDVFISYSQKDAADFARRLNAELQLQGQHTWFDQESIAPEADFQQEIYQGIEGSDVFLFVLSPEAVNSPYCVDEVNHASSLNKRIVTLLYREFNAVNLPLALRNPQWIDFSRDGNFDPNFQRLLTALNDNPQHLHQHTRLLVRAGEWERRGRDESLLLRGQDLATAAAWLENYAEVEPKPTGLQQEYIRAGRAKQEAQAAAEKKLRRGALIGAIAAAAGIVVAAISGGAAWYLQNEALKSTSQARWNVASATQQERSANRRTFQAEALAGSAVKQAQKAQRDQQQAEAKAEDAEIRALEADSKAQDAAVAQQQSEASAQAAAQKAAVAENRATEATSRAAEAEKAQILAQTGTRLERAGVDILGSLGNESAPSALATALIHAEGLRNITHIQQNLEDFPAISPILALQSVLDNLEAISFKAHQGPVYDLSFSSGLNRFTTLGGDGYIKVWHLADLASASEPRPRYSWRLSDDTHAIALEMYDDSDHEVILSVSEDGHIQKWNLQGQELGKIRLSDKKLAGLKVLAGNSHAVVISTEENKSWIVDLSNFSVSNFCDLSTQTNEAQRSNFRQSNKLNSRKSINPDGTLAFPSGGQSVLLIDLKTCQKISEIETDGDMPLYTTFSSNGNRLAIFMMLSNIARIYDFKQSENIPKLISALPLSSQLRYSGYIAQELPELHLGTHFSASKGGDGSLKLWDSTGRPLWNYNFPNIQRVHFGVNDNIVAISTSDGIVNLRYYPPHDNRKVLSSHQCSYPEGGSCTVENFTISSNGNLMAWLTADGRVITSVGEIPLHEQIGGFRFEDFTYRSARFISSGNAGEIHVLATDKVTGSIIVLRYIVQLNGDLEALGGNRMSQISFIKNSDIARVALSKNGQKAAILTMDGTLAVWDVDSGEISSGQIFSGQLNSVAIPEIEIQGNRYVSVSSRVGKSFVYDILSGSYIRSGQIEQENQTIAFSSNNSLMYVANSNAGTISILDFSGSLKDSWQAHQSSNFLHIKVTPDGNRVITLGQEGDHVAVKAWTSNGQLLGQWRVTTGRRSDAFLAISLDGKFLAAQGNLSGDIAQVWELETLDELISRGCERLENYHRAMVSLPPDLPESCDIPGTQSIPFESSLGHSLMQVQVTWPEQG